MKDNIIKTFSELAKPFKDKKGGEKLDILIERLKKININYEWIPGIGVIVNKQTKPKKVIVSHIDLISKFNKGFSENKVAILDDKLLIGALDNTITNAVLLLLIEKLHESNSLDGLEFLFSEGEEVGSIGMDNYIKNNYERVSKSFFINLDVTNEGFNKSNVSIEYDACNFDCLKEIQKSEKATKNKYHYTHSRVCDDTDAILGNKCHGFSYCLPTYDLIHSYRNKVLIDSLEPFFEGLYNLILIQSKSFNNASQNVFSWNFEEALIAKSLKKLNKNNSDVKNLNYDLSETIISLESISNRKINNHPIDVKLKDLFTNESNKQEMKIGRILLIALYDESTFFKKMNDIEREYFSFTIIEQIEAGYFSSDFFTYVISNPKFNSEIIKIFMRNKFVSYDKKEDIYNFNYKILSKKIKKV